jgi:CDK inhibitor PHO81
MFTELLVAHILKLIQLLPMGISVMLHVAYPGCDLREELCMGRCADVNAYVEAILKTVYQSSASLGSTPHSRRRFAFMAHSPSVCTALNWKQPNCKLGRYFSRFFCLQRPADAVFFATHGGVDPQAGHDDASGTARSTDRRCLSVANAVEFAKSNNLLGILVNARLLVR